MCGPSLLPERTLFGKSPGSGATAGGVRCLGSMEFITRARFWFQGVRRKRRFRKEHREGARTARPGPLPLVVVLDHPLPLGNPAAIVRSADAFGARAVYVVGTDHFEPRPAMGSLRHVPVRFFATFSEAHSELVAEGYTLFALEPARNYEKPALLHTTAFPEKTALVVGHERTGISFSPAAFERVVCLTIAQHGVTPCLNASVAAGVAMYEYVRQHAVPTPE